MSRDVYFRDDIRAGVLGVAVAALRGASSTGTPDVSYCAGVVDAVHAVALVHGLGWDDLQDAIRAQLHAVGVQDVLALDLLGAETGA